MFGKRSALTACLMASAAFAQSSPRHARGHAEVWIADGEDGRSTRRVRLVSSGAEPLELDGDLAVETGDLLTVETRDDGRMATSRITGRTKAPPACPGTGAQKAAVLLVYDTAAAPPAVSPQSIHDIFFAATPPSASQYWHDASTARLDMTGTVFGWRQLSRTYDFCSQHDAMFDEAMKLHSRELRGQGYTRFFLVSPRTRSCGWAGMSTVGCSTLGASRTVGSASYLALDYLTERSQGVTLAVHEGGHQLGLDHSASVAFSGEAFGPPAVYGSVDEYGDLYSAMGWWNQGAYGTPMKAKLGWLDAGAGYQTVETTSAFTVLPHDAAAGGLRALRVRRGAAGDSWLWIEYRAGMGAQVRYERPGDGRSFLVDFTPATWGWGDGALGAGQSWTDPYSNLTVRVAGVSASAMSVIVEYR